MTEVTSHSFTAPDGVNLGWHETGVGGPVVLLHGLFSSADMNWIRFGHAAEIAGRGFRVIMPDLRAHGTSEPPRDPAAYPPDILVEDAEALIRHLGLSDYDLGGYSLGGRTVARMLIAGVRPRRAIIAGMGLEGLLDTRTRAEHFREMLQGFGSWERGSRHFMAQAFLKTTGSDPEALMLLLDSFTDSLVAELEAIRVPTLVVQGDEDDDNGSAEALCRLLPDATFVEVPGGHMSCITKPEFGRAIAAFLAA
jgi:pimeloyl-ACP methyl ester carboxylesterase